MKLSEFGFEVPEKLIASHPCENRDEARLMVVHKSTGKIEHKLFKDMLVYFGQDDTIVVNDTKVFPALLIGTKEKTNAQVEVTLLRELNEEQNLWDTLVEPARKIRVGNKIYFGGEELVAEVLDNTTSRGRTLKFLFDGSKQDLHSVIDHLGNMPVPAIIKRKPEEADRINYQTVYAKHTGAVVVPAAGLHFTPQLLKRLELKGAHIAPISLFIGLNTLETIDVEDLTRCKTDSEFSSVSESTAQIVNNSIDKKKQVCAVGTSTAKTLESFVSVSKKLKVGEKWSNFFPSEENQFKICTSLITNFHLPKTIPLITAFAFGGHELMAKAYQEAIKEKYRFFVYGDAMLII